MGNLCGKQSKDAFDGPGRTLGSAPAPATKASVPSGSTAKSTPPKRTVGGPPRTLGESNSGSDPGVAAATAAEARANKTPTGPLQRKLDAQKKMTTESHLRAVSKENTVTRDMDKNSETVQYR